MSWMILRFTDEGLLPPGVHESDLEDLGCLAPIFPPSASNWAEAKRRFGVDFFPAAATELGSGQPFLRFFQTDREGRERGVLLVDLQARRWSHDPHRQGISAQQGAALRA
jgi:hypothetical protein